MGADREGGGGYHPPGRRASARRARGYALAAGAVAMAIVLRVVFVPYLEVGFLTLFVAAVALSAWYGGFGPGAFATLLLGVAAAYIFLEPAGSFRVSTPNDAIRLSLFFSVGFFVTALTSALRRAQARAEASRERALEALADRERAEAERRAVETRSRRILEGVRDVAIFTLDGAGRVATWNAGAERLYGYREAEIVGEPAVRLAAASSSEPGSIRESCRIARTEGRFETTGWHERRDGGRFFADLLLVPLDPPFVPGELVAVVRDVTQGREAEARLDRVDEEFREFVVWTAHEVGEPARSAETVLEYVESLPSVAQDPEAREMLARVRVNVARIKGMLKGLREFGALSTTIPLATVDADDAIDRALARLAECIATTRARVTLPRLVPPVLGNADLLEEVVVALVENAIVHHAGPGPHVVLEARATPEGRWILEVRDDGPGIPPALREHVFRAFRRGPSTPREHLATGIGLTLARRAVHAMGGTIGIAEAPEGGACVTVVLGAPPGPADADDAARRSGTGDATV